MSSNSPRRLPLRMATSTSDPSYYWPNDPPSLQRMPYFQATPLSLNNLLRTSSRREPVDLTFSNNDCMTASGIQNCTAACSNPTMLFDFANLRTCVLMASAALLVQNETYFVDMADTPTLNTIDTFVVPNFTTFNAVGVLTRVAKCVTQSCIESTLGDCTNQVVGMGNITIVNANNLTNFTGGLGDYCDLAEYNVNGDMAGPGVVLAYLLQIGLAIMLHLCLKFTTTWTRKSYNLLSRCEARNTGKGTRKRGEQLQSSMAASRFGAALISTLVEFQEVQIYFVASIQIATLISFNEANLNVGSVNSSSYGGSLLNSVAITTLSVTSVSCVLLIQRSLQRVGMHWWYPFVTMTVTFALALVIFGSQKALMPSVDGLWDKFKQDSRLSLCGDNPSPMTYCRPPSGASITRDVVSVHAVGSAGSVVWMGLLVDQIISTAGDLAAKLPLSVQRWLFGANPDRTVNNIRAWPDKVGEWKKTKTGTWVSRAYDAIMSLGVLWMIASYVSALRPLVMRIDIGDTSGWTFGQFVALAVWVPTIVKYVYYNIFGIEGGFEERIAANYTISRDSDPNKPATILEEKKLPHASTYPLLARGEHGSAGSRGPADSTESAEDSPHRTW